MAKEKQLCRDKRKCFYSVLKSEYLELGSEKAVGGWPLGVGKIVNIELRATAFRHKGTKGTKVHEVIADKS